MSPPAGDGAAESRRGVLYACAAFGFWGLVPIYFKEVAFVPPLEVLAHRTFWSLLLLAPLALLWGRGRNLRAMLAERRSLMLLAVSTLLLASNWLIFIWAVGAGRLIEVSLGYYINPLVSVMLGFLFLRERLRSLQWVGVGLASLGVAIFAVAATGLPWVSIALPLTFGLYGLARKVARFGALEGLLLETALLAPVALAFLLLFAEVAPLGGGGASLVLLTALSGVVTALPLLWFAAAARRLPLATLGFLQYIAPSMQFLLAVLFYGEPLTSAKLATFLAIWTACLLFSLGSFTQRSRVPIKG